MSTAAGMPANYDEGLVGDYVLPPLSLDGARATAADPEEARTAQRAWRRVFAEGLFGELPPPPTRLAWERHPLAEGDCERIAIRLEADERQFQVNAALWLPPHRTGPVPIVIGLDFLGPVGSLQGEEFPLDPDARVALPQWLGGGQGSLAEVLRGTAAHRFPVSLLTDAGYAVLTSCYGSWVPDDPVTSREHGVRPLLDLYDPQTAPGTVCLWSWSLLRLVDIAAQLQDVDASAIVVAGHSRLGKAALWASVNDERISALFLNESGCGGASLSRRNFGESFAHNRQAFPHWLLSEDRATRAGLDNVDQHQLLALMAPRRLYVASAADDLWCDPRGEYLGLKAAAPFWSAFGIPSEFAEEPAFTPGSQVKAGALGWHLREGGHELTPYDWTRFMRFMEAK